MSEQPCVWLNGLKYVWSPKYCDFVNWFTPPNGDPVGTRYSDVLARASKEDVAFSVLDRHNELLTEFRKFDPVKQHRVVLDGMLKEERKILPMLKEQGRSLILDDGREPDISTDGKSLPLRITLGKPRLYSDFIIVDLLSETDGLRTQRRFYDVFGRVLQDIDYKHGKEFAHVFPHIHIYLEGIKGGRSFPIRFADSSVVVQYTRGAMMEEDNDVDLTPHKEQSRQSGIDWCEKHYYKFEDVERFFGAPFGSMRMNLDELLVLLSYGHELEITYKGWDAFITPFGIFGFRAESTNGEQKQEYECVDIEEFADNAKVGPYFIKHIVGDWRVTALF